MIENKISDKQQYINKLETEVALNLADKIFRATFYNNSLAMTISRLSDGLIIGVNEAYLNTMGFKLEEVVGKTAHELGIWLQSDDRDQLLKELTETGHFRDKEYMVRRANGDICHTLTSASLVEIDGEQYLLNSSCDITERKRAELQLRASEDKFSKSFHESGAMKAIIRLKDGVFIDINESYASTLGFRRETMIGKTVLELGIWEDSLKRPMMREDLLSQGCIRNCESEFRNKSGESVCVVSNMDIIDINGEECILVSCYDITKLKQYEREIARLDKLDLMGQMAGSIAHEIRNPMTSIKGFLQLFLEQYRYREDRPAIELMIEELDRMNDIISDFLSLSKVSYIELKPMKLNDCINEVLQLIVADALKNDVFVQTVFQDASPIMLDKGELRQLLLNLTRNAIDAMPAGGTLTIRTFADSNGMNLVVDDEGEGIPPEIMEKIWTPFVTTKGNGTGLGLPVCKSIAERHNATITCDTSPLGTSFKVTFPEALATATG